MIKIKEKKGIYVLFDLIKYTWNASPRVFLLLVIISLFTSILSFLELIVVENLFDRAVMVYSGGENKYLYTAVFLLLWILVLIPVAEWLEFLVRGYFWRRSSGYMKGLYHLYIGNMSAIEFEDTHNFDELQKANEGSEDAPDGLRIIIQMLFLYIPYILSLLIYLLSISEILAFIIVLIFIPTLVLEIVRMKENFSFEDVIANQKRKTSYLESCIVSKEYFKETLLNGSFAFFNKLFMESNSLYNRKYITVRKKMLRTAIILKALNVLGFCGVLMILVFCTYNNQISIGLFAAVYYSLSKIANMLKRLLEDVGDALDDISTTSFLVRLLDAEDDKKSKDVLLKSQDIVLRNICFKYPNDERMVLNDINLTIKAGNSVAIVGENGAGKSTLSKIILGLYRPTSGVVLMGNSDIANFSKTSRFKDVSAVFQDFVKYKLSLKDNVILGEVESKQDIQRTLKAARLELEKMGVDTETILSREFEGQDLSGGEWQRLAIARGLYRCHEIIILDEPTSAIDPIEEANIFDDFKKISNGKTCIFVTHRLGSTKMADRILVLDNGKVVEDGTHIELINKKGKYYQLLKSQAQWYERDEKK